MSRWSRRQQTPDAAPAWRPDAWPCDSETLERWIRDAVLTAHGASEVQIDGLDGIRISADVTGTEIALLLIDATDAAITALPGTGTASITDAATLPDELDPVTTPEVITRTPGLLRSARLVASPVVVQGFDLHLDATIDDVPFDWTHYAAEQRPGHPATAFGFEESEPDTQHAISGHFSARMRTADVAPLALIRRQLREVEGEQVDLNAGSAETAAPRLHDVRITADRDLTLTSRLG